MPVKLYNNPYDPQLSNRELAEILMIVRDKLGELIQAGYEDEKYSRESFAATFSDPTSPHWELTEERLLGSVFAGPNGADFLPNSIGKVCSHLDRNMEAGEQIHTNRHMVPSGEFRYGYTVEVRGIVAGGSGATERQDQELARTLAELLATELCNALHAKDAEAASALPDGEVLRWTTPDNNPPGKYRAIDSEIDL